MKLSDREKYPGLYNIDATELDDVAYGLFYNEKMNKISTGDHLWTQEGFLNRISDEEKNEYYKQATILLRGLKIDKLKNETEI